MLDFADIYDQIYQSKNYSREVCFALDCMNDLGGVSPNVFLDLGCGTGGHTEVLSRHFHYGYGFDIDKGLLGKAKRLDNVTYYSYDFTISACGFEPCDLVTAYFNVLNYILDEDKLENGFRNIYNLLEERGLFVFDIYNYNRLLIDPPKSNKEQFDYFDKLTFPCFDGATQFLGLSNVIQTINDNLTYFISHRIWTEQRIKGIVEKVGFKIEYILGDFDFNSNKNSSYKNVWVLQK